MSNSELEALTIKAMIVCRLAHKGQMRRDGSTPYHTHPTEVANNVPLELKPIAFLHDTLEDTDLGELSLRALGFPEYVVDAVVALTRLSIESYDEYVTRLMRNPSAVAVKIADMEHNYSCNPSENSKAKIEKWLPILKAKNQTT